MYYEYFGLRDAPFQFLPSNTLFLSDAHIEGLAALEWAFQEPSGLTLLAGEVGTGKTMLIHALGYASERQQGSRGATEQSHDEL